ncbi:MAG: DUF2518 family protein [Acidobacteriota bacterium]
MSRIRPSVFLLAVTLSLHWACGGSGASHPQGEAQPVPYKVIYDHMGTNLGIGVDPNITDSQLRATLRKAADDHQRDRGRDYLFYEHLWVRAYLVTEMGQSSVPAGTIRRYVPPFNPQYKEGWMDRVTQLLGARRDKLYINIKAARRKTG